MILHDERLTDNPDLIDGIWRYALARAAANRVTASGRTTPRDLQTLIEEKQAAAALLQLAYRLGIEMEAGQ